MVRRLLLSLRRSRKGCNARAMFHAQEDDRQADPLLFVDHPALPFDGLPSTTLRPFWATYPPDSRPPFASVHQRPSLPSLWTTVTVPGPVHLNDPALPITPSTPGFPGPLDVPWSGIGSTPIDTRFNAQRYSDFHVKMSELSWQGMSSGDALVKEHCQRIEQETGERSKVLDVGCGTGAWAYERGEAGLDCDVLGIEWVSPLYYSAIAAERLADWLIADATAMT